MMTLRTRRLYSLASLGILLALGLALLPHLRLDRTSPAANSVLEASPEEVRLFFSEAPEMRGTTVRLATSGTDALIETTSAVANPEDPREVFIRPLAPLPAGSYTVHWRVLARDGHAQRGTFDFRVGAR
jgi:copper resistance protein C